ncbi:MAG TPA: Rieske 2Fe-2S domain-containing protein [Thermoanaerobaculia bacterium]|jgi:multimeric flavodoxin WrbA/nitrite reductase/ring-hydroxylating ferredoxin subunit|nr:Rieske 2Fe-2S domain-containing protein [Thermoanaerobaculia bacterium]
MDDASWHDLGAVEELAAQPLRQITIGRTKIALTCKDGSFGAISGACNHVGGPLGQGTLDGDYVVCPWHHWKFHCRTGEGEPGFEQDCVPRYELKEENGRLFLNLRPATRRNKLPHAPDPLARPVRREEGPVRVLGISTTVMDPEHPRYSTSEALLETALAAAAEQLGAETRCLRLSALKFRPCEGYYSKSAHACTWPCSITQIDPADEMREVYEGIVHWSDVILVATPIRWGSASSLYYKMVERMNCVQNQVTLNNRVLLRNKVAAFIITGGQDNVQAVAGQLLGFFGEVGCVFPQFPYIAHSRGWTAEDMERNVAYVQSSESLHQGARELTARAVTMANVLLTTQVEAKQVCRGGRKGSRPMAPESPAEMAAMAEMS